jgi:RNA polymerase-binding transcription factor DksA
MPVYGELGLAQKAITQRERRLLQEMNQVRAPLQLISDCCAQGCDRVIDIVDQANHTVELATDRALYHLYREKPGQLEQAWTRLCTGRYGVCASCGAQIDPARLDVLPHATLYTGCQRDNGSGISKTDHCVDCSGM